jgi:hypothetical protein
VLGCGGMGLRPRSYLNLAELLALRPDLASARKLLYALPPECQLTTLTAGSQKSSPGEMG